jgi:hypothetical protein
MSEENAWGRWLPRRARMLEYVHFLDDTIDRDFSAGGVVTADTYRAIERANMIRAYVKARSGT